MTFTFGIYPGGLLGSESELVYPVRPDDPALITDALRRLQGTAPTLHVRTYLAYLGAGRNDAVEAAPADPAQYAQEGRKIDLVLSFHDKTGDLSGWPDFIRAAVRAEGPRLASVQICEEPNLDLPIVDGSSPNVLEAVVSGVTVAKEEALACGYPELAVGFNAVPSFDPADTFWPALGALADERFRASLDYVALDFFPDVFRPVPAGGLADAVAMVLRGFRRDSLTRAGIGAEVPIRIGENGWPTGEGRDDQRQAEAVETIVRTLHGLRGELNLTGYSLFALRDANSAGESLFDQFGLLRDDYTEKPAFSTYARLISELSR